MLATFKTRVFVAPLMLLAMSSTLLLSAQTEPLSPRNANYDIEVTLHPQAKTLSGREVIRWKNIQSTSTQELWFHLYYNAWRNSRSTWFRQRALRGELDLSKIQDNEWGSCEVTSVRLLNPQGEGVTDLLPSAHFESPNDGNPDDRTVLVVALPEAVQPGQEVSVEVEWESRIPKTFARTGYQGDFFFLAHWFPKLGVFQEDGTWNCHQFHSNTEFFSDYGIYDVQITVPENWLVGATGVEVNRSSAANRMAVHRYRQEDVHDFTWTTSPDYREARDRFEETGLPPVEMRLLYQPEHEAQVGRHFRAAKAALQYYGSWYGPYPYGQVTLIDPAWKSGAGGMEYPTLFTCGTRYFNPEGGGSPEGVTIHEAGHQFWYGVVGNNEFENAWLDEGLNTFSTARTAEAAFGQSFAVERFFKGFIPIPLREVRRDRMLQGNRLDGYRPAARSDRQSRNTFEYYPSFASAITYNKTALWLGTLEKTYGWETLQRILSTFYREWSFRHPKPADFFEIANRESGMDLTPFFDQVHRSSAVFDFAVDRVQSRPVLDSGWFGQEGSLQAAADPTLQESDPIFETTVIVRRLQDGILPVEILLKFENGEQQFHVWDGRDEWKLIRVLTGSKLEYASVDPEHKLLLDINYSNNSKLLKPRSDLAASKWASKWMVWMQDLMQTLAFLM